MRFFISDVITPDFYAGSMLMVPALPTAKVFLAVGHTDMRKSINGLSILVENNMELDPFCGHLSGFCNRKRDIVKILCRLSYSTVM